MQNIVKKLVFILVATVSLNAVELVIDGSHSEVGFSVKHMMISNVKGKFNEFDGDIDFDVKTKTFKKFDGKISATSIDTANQKRDDHLRTADFFDVKKFPDITFKMTKYTPKGDEGEMEGELSMHGVTKSIKLNVNVNGIIKDKKENIKAGFTITGEISRKEFGLTYNKVLEFGGVAIGDEVKIIIELETMAL